MALCVVWLFTVTAGLVFLANYEISGNTTGLVPTQWPAKAGLPLDARHDTLLLFAHPRCPCTRSTVGELNRLMAKVGGRVKAHVLFFSPEGTNADWADTDLWHSAAAIPGVTVSRDTNGTQALLFGAETSGFVVLYDPQGRLQFHGGITAGRGHAGDNEGEDAIANRLLGRPSRLSATPVYGCSLGACPRPAAEGAQ